MSVVRDRPARLVGRTLVRHDAVEKVAGRTRYAADFGLPGMLHAALKRADLPHARLLRVDTSAAQAVPGVASVLTAKDVPENTVWVDVPGQTFQVGALKARANVLADGVVRYHGEPIAIVAAETEDAAVAAVELIDVDYEELPVVDDSEAALEDGAPCVHEEAQRADDFALACAAAVVKPDGGARVVVGGVGDRPLRFDGAPDELAAMVEAEVDPEEEAFVSAAFRRRLAVVCARRALARAQQDAAA